MWTTVRVISYVENSLLLCIDVQLEYIFQSFYAMKRFMKIKFLNIRMPLQFVLSF